MVVVFTFLIAITKIDALGKVDHLSYSTNQETAAEMGIQASQLY